MDGRDPASPALSVDAAAGADAAGGPVADAYGAKAAAPHAGRPPVPFPAKSGAWLPAAVAVAGFLALPFGRPGRPLFVLDPAYHPWALGSPLLWLVLAGAGTALALALAGPGGRHAKGALPLPGGRRADLILAAGVVAFVAAVAWLITTATPFGPGAVVTLTALVVVMGHALSESGRVRGDAFVASGILLVSLLVLLFIIYPLATVLRSAVFIEGAFDLSALHRTVTHPRFRNALPTSLLTAAIVAPACTLLGLGFALLAHRARRGAVRRSLNVVAVLPIVTPPFLLAFAMIFLLGRRGLVTHELLGLSTSWIFGVPGVAMAQVLAFTPVAYLLLRGAVAALDPALEDAARTLGAGRWTTLRTVTWPLLRPALAAAFLLSVIESLADFGNPLILGGERHFLATEVYLALTGRYDPHEAASYGVVLLGIVLVAFLLQRWWLGGGSFITVTGRPGGGRGAPLPVGLERVLVGVLALWTISVAALYLSIVAGSFTELWGVNYALTLRHYRDFMAAGWPVFLYSVRIAAMAAAPAMLLGLLVAYLLARHRFFGRRLLEFGALLSFATPGTVMGVAYVFAFNTGPWLLTATGAIIALALIFRNMPVTIRAGMAGLAQLDRSLEEASTTMRATSFTTLRRVVLPLLLNTVLVGLIFAFVAGMTAVSQVIFLVSPGNQLATVLLLGWVEQGQLGRAAAMGTVLVGSMLLAIMVVLALARRVGFTLYGGEAAR